MERIAPIPDVFHKDGNELNNTRSNLEIKIRNPRKKMQPKTI